MVQQIASRHVQGKYQKLVNNRAYDSDPLDAELEVEDLELIAPYWKDRKKPKMQDGRKLQRYKGRWKVL